MGEFEEGEELFDDEGNATEETQSILAFCEQFEQSGARTRGFVAALTEHDLLIDGELELGRRDSEERHVFRGFRMVSEERLRALDDETLARMTRNGMLPLIYAHMFSLQLVRHVFARERFAPQQQDQEVEA